MHTGVQSGYTWTHPPQMSTHMYMPSNPFPVPPPAMCASTHLSVPVSQTYERRTRVAHVHTNLFYALCTRARTRARRVSTGLLEHNLRQRQNNQNQSYFNAIFLKIKINTKMHEDQNTEVVKTDLTVRLPDCLPPWASPRGPPSGGSGNTPHSRQVGSQGPVQTRPSRRPHAPRAHLETRNSPCPPHLRSPPATGRPASGDQRGPPHTRTSARTKWWPHSFSGASGAGGRPRASTRAGLSSTSAQGSGRGSIVAGGARAQEAPPL